MATRTISRTDLVGVSSLSFIRPQVVNFTIAKTKPLTRFYAFFDGLKVDQYITPAGGILGGEIVTDASGSISGTFSIPAFTFNTGERVLRFQDVSEFESNIIAGTTVGSATAKFTANGLKNTYQTTATNITEVIVTVTHELFQPPPVIVNIPVPTPVPTPVYVSVPDYSSPTPTPTPAPIPTPVPAPPRGSFLDEDGNPTDIDNSSGMGGDPSDPLAQTFFTYGVTGGCFITKIDIWFQTKDSTLPVTLELRNVVNGYPGPNLVSKWSSVTLPPSAVNISDNSSIPTTFTFTRPIYLQESKDYCFVLMANSNKYNVWTSKFGDISVETGNTIFEQPYIGSLFKSENNITWTAEQTDDIKFRIYKAEFDISTPYSFTSKVNAPPILLRGSALSVTDGSAVVVANLTFQHGHKTGDKVAFNGVTDSVYRGIPESVLSNSTGFTITVTSDYSFTFNCGVPATSAGTLAFSGILNYVDIDDTGSGYVAPVATVSGGGATTQATLGLTVTSGKITGVTVLTKGSGYISQPTIVVTDAAGTGAVLTGIADSIFSTVFNRKFQNVIPTMFVQTPPSTSIYNLLKTSDKDYVVGQYEVIDINESTNLGKHAVIATQMTDSLAFGGNSSTEMITTLASANPNVSPLIDMAEAPKLILQNYIINDDSNSASELTPAAGTSYSRYLSKITTIDTISTGVRIFVAAASTSSNSFEVFFRSSLTSNNSNHKSGNWVKLTCDTETNLSSTPTEFKDYLFYKDNISPFDAYDLKIVLYSDNSYSYPTISNYRSIILAT